MAFIPAPDCAEVTVRQTLFGEQVVNVLHFLRQGGYDIGGLNDLAAMVLQVWDTAMLDEQSEDLTLVEVAARNLETQDGLQVVQQPQGAAAGRVAFGSLPANVAYVVTKRSALVGRSRRGRVYLAGIPENRVTGNALAAPAASAMVSALEQIRLGAIDIGQSFVILSRYTNGQPRPFGIPTLVTNLTATDLRVDSQRRRLPG